MDGQDEVINNHNDDVDINNNNNNYNNDNNNIGGQSSIVKGKRTKRQRPQSPIPFRMITPNNSNNSTKSDEGSDICSNNNVVDEIITRTTTLSDEEEDTYYLGTGTTTTTTSTNEEEEEMANCLILLAQGHSRDIDEHIKSGKRAPLSLFDNDNEHLQNNNNNHFQPNTTTSTKFISRKFMEAPTTAGKSGYYVYECKTCSKTFPSFQALGGHRASHKKPKNNKDDDRSIKINNRSSNANLLSLILSNNNRGNLLLSSEEENPTFKSNLKHNTSSSSLSLQLTNRALYNDGHNISSNSNNRARIHECAICGAEFSSGQALGGHMRRHRGPVNGVAVATMPISAVERAVAMEKEWSPTYITDRVMQEVAVHMVNDNSIPPRNMNVNINSGSMLNIDLDLNLPAPSEDHHHVVDNKTESKFAYASEQPQQDDQQTSLPQQQQNHPPQPQQQILVFSSPALVDCHY